MELWAPDWFYQPELFTGLLITETENVNKQDSEFYKNFVDYLDKWTDNLELSVWSLPVLPVSVWAFSGYSGFHLQSKGMQSG